MSAIRLIVLQKTPAWFRRQTLHPASKASRNCISVGAPFKLLDVRLNEFLQHIPALCGLKPHIASGPKNAN